MDEFIPIYHADASHLVDFKIAVQQYCRNEGLLGDRHPIPYLLLACAWNFVKIAFVRLLLKV